MAKRTNYDRGRETEYKIIHELREKGMINPVRTAGSHGMFDVIAIDCDMVLFIQAKRSKTKISFAKLYKDDLNEMLDVLPFMPRDAQIETWVWVDRLGWQEKLVIKRAGTVLNEHDVFLLKMELEDGINPFLNLTKTIDLQADANGS